MTKYKILRGDRANQGSVKPGEIVYKASDFYGLCREDAEYTGLEHICVSYQESGVPCFTIPVWDVERITE